jgi:integrase
MSELEPCPFCGGYHVTNEGVTNKSIHCVDCGAYGPEPAYDAIDVDWNTRAAPKVKALEWMPDSENRGFIAVTSVGQFAVFDEGCPRWAFSGRYNSGYRYFKTDTFEEAGNAAADRAMSVLKRILQFGINMEMIDHHPLKDVNKLYSGSRKDIIWTDADIKKLKAIDNEKITQALVLGLWTGQRQGDLLKLRWNAYDGHTLSIEQSKTKTYARVKVSAELKTMLDSMERTAVTILTNQAGKPWGTGFKSSWRKSLERAGIEGLNYHDLRGTFVTLAWRNGASIEEIADVTGHTIKYAERIIRKHYLVSGGAVEKIEKRKR